MIRCALVLILFAPASAAAEIYVPPGNVRDPASKSKDTAADLSLPYVHLEPHDFCFDAARPLTVTLSAVNRSGKRLTIDWRAVTASLVLEPVGPGRVTPVRNRPAQDAVEVGPTDLAQITIDLKDYFTVEGAAVYKLSYSRPLDEGRV